MAENLKNPKYENKRIGRDWTSSAYGDNVRIWFRTHLSEQDYLDYLARVRGFEDDDEYDNFLANQKGFNDNSDYHHWIRSGKIPKRKNATNKLDIVDPIKLDKIPVTAEIRLQEKEANSQKIITKLTTAINKLPEREKRVIKSRFYERKTLEETGKELKVGSERARQI